MLVCQSVGGLRITAAVAVVLVVIIIVGCYYCCCYYCGSWCYSCLALPCFATLMMIIYLFFSTAVYSVVIFSALFCPIHYSVFCVLMFLSKLFWDASVCVCVAMCTLYGVLLTSSSSFPYMTNFSFLYYFKLFLFFDIFRSNTINVVSSSLHYSPCITLPIASRMLGMCFFRVCCSFFVTRLSFFG